MENVKRVVHKRAVKADDLEVHVSTLKTDLGEYTDIREYIPSLERYGRGVTFPTSLNKGLGVGKVAA